VGSMGLNHIKQSQTVSGIQLQIYPGSTYYKEVVQRQERED